MNWNVLLWRVFKERRGFDALHSSLHELDLMCASRRRVVTCGELITVTSAQSPVGFRKLDEDLKWAAEHGTGSQFTNQGQTDNERLNSRPSASNLVTKIRLRGIPSNDEEYSTVRGCYRAQVSSPHVNSSICTYLQEGADTDQQRWLHRGTRCRRRIRMIRAGRLSHNNNSLLIMLHL